MTAKITHDAPFGSAVAPAGSEGWAIRWKLSFQSVVRDLESDPKRAGSYLEIGEKWRAWTLLKDVNGKPFATFKRFCEAPLPHGLQYDAKKFRHALALALGADNAVVAVTFANAEPVAKAGPPAGNANAKKRPNGNNKVDQVNVDSPKGGNRSEYLAGRIKAKAETDPKAAEVVARVERGEYSSMRQAARDAGVTKPVDTIKVAARAIAAVPTYRLAEMVALLSPELRNMLFASLKDQVGS